MSQITDEQRAPDQQLAMAGDVQAGLAPDMSVAVPGAEVAMHYKSAMCVGGDYCEMWPSDDGRLGFAVGDVSGKGPPAAMVTSDLQAAIRTTGAFCASPAETMAHVNRHLCASTPEGTFVTLFFGLFDPGSGRLEFVNAGHPPPLTVSADGDVRQLAEPRNLPLGLVDRSFIAGVWTIDPDGGLLVVTDGITEAMSPENRWLGLAGLEEYLVSSAPRSADEMVRAATEAAASFRCRRPPEDDVTAFALVHRRSSEPAA